jgi:hypothetical protein
MSLTAHITGIGVAHADGSFEVSYEVRDDADHVVAAHSQGFPAGTERDTVVEAISNYVRDVVPLLMEPPAVALGDMLTIE